MSTGYRKRGMYVPQTRIPDNEPVEQYSFKQGLRKDLTPREMPLDATPDMKNIRIEQNSIRQDFGFEQVGENTQYEVLGIAEHRYILNQKEFQRIVRIVRDFDEFVILQTWDGTQWLNSIPTTIRVGSAPMSMVSTQNKFVFTNGGKILVWEEPDPGMLRIQQNWPHPGLGDIKRDNGSRVTITTKLDRKAASDTEQINASYDIRLRFTPAFDPKLPPLANGGYTVRVVTAMEHSYDGINFHLSGTRKHEHSFDSGSQSTVEQFVDISPTPTHGVSIPKALGVTHVRFRVTQAELITDNPVRGYVKSWGYTIFSRSKTDSPAGLDYWAVDDAGGTVDYLNEIDAPQATFIAPFGDRLIALRDVGDPQHLAASRDGNIDVWISTDTYSASLLDTVHDPLDPLQALAFISDNQAALLRSRNIMRVEETGNPNLPIAVNPWIEGIGTESPFTVAQARDGIMFLGFNFMMYYWDGSGHPVPVGIPIHTELIGKLTGGLARLTGGYDPVWEEYWLCTPVGTWVFRLGAFLDNQQIIWRERSEIIDRVTVVREF